MVSTTRPTEDCQIPPPTVQNPLPSGRPGFGTSWTAPPGRCRGCCKSACPPLLYHTSCSFRRLDSGNSSIPHLSEGLQPLPSSPSTHSQHPSLNDAKGVFPFPLRPPPVLPSRASLSRVCIIAIAPELLSLKPLPLEQHTRIILKHRSVMLCPPQNSATPCYSPFALHAAIWISPPSPCTSLNPLLWPHLPSLPELHSFTTLRFCRCYSLCLECLSISFTLENSYLSSKSHFKAHLSLADPPRKLFLPGSVAPLSLSFLMWKTTVLATTNSSSGLGVKALFSPMPQSTTMTPRPETDHTQSLSRVPLTAPKADQPLLCLIQAEHQQKPQTCALKF